MTKYTVEYWIERTDNSYPEKKDTVDELPEEGDSITIRGRPHVVTQVEKHEDGYYEVYVMELGLYREQNSWRFALGRVVVAFALLGFGILFSIYKVLSGAFGKFKGTAASVKKSIGDLLWE